MLKKWKYLSIEVYAAIFGWRVEIDFIPFQWAKPQFGFSRSMGEPIRKPSLKAGPFSLWTMSCEKVELGIAADLRAAFHTVPFQAVYPGAVVWPKYQKKKA